MNSQDQINRRRFLTEASAVGASISLAPTFLNAAEAGSSASGKIRVGYIGCGSVSGAYLPHLTRQDYIEVVSVCDLIPERARKRAEAFKVPHVYSNIDEQLRGVPFDLLVNTTSMPSHHPVNERALEAGRNVWSEKPMALEVGKARELMNLAKKKGVQIWAAPTCVTSPQFKFMAETIGSGKLGRVTAGHGTYGHSGPTWSAWFYEKGGGSLYDLGVYNVTTLTGLLGPAKAVVGMTAVLNKTRKVEDKGEVEVTADENTMLIMDHGNGVFSHIQTGFGYFEHEHLPAKRGTLYTVDIMGNQGAMHLQGWDWGPVGVDVAFKGEPELETFCRDPWPTGWSGGASYVAKCMLDRTPSLITADQALHVLEVMNGCHESQRTGRRVNMETTFRWPLFG